MSFEADVDLAGIDGYLDAVADRGDDALRPSAQAGSQVLYERTRQNVAALRQYTGNLYKSIYQAYSADNSSQARVEYHVSWRTGQSGLPRAPHGHLVEYGYLQRYRYYQGADGEVRPMVRPGMDGMPRPGRNASQAAKDAYYVTLPSPVQVPGKAFLRSAANAMPQAQQAAEDEWLRHVLEEGAS